MYTPLFQKILAKVLENRVYTIWFLGDSITSTERIHPNRREIVEYVLKAELEVEIQRRYIEGELELSNEAFDWQYNPDELASEYMRRIPSWNLRCLNLARDGSTTRDRVKHQDKRLWEHRSIDLLIVVGTCNDAAYNVPVDETLTNIDSLFLYCKNTLHIKDVIYATPSYSTHSEQEQKYIPYIKAIREKYSISDFFLDLWKEMELLPEDEITSFYGMKNIDESLDFEHPNVLGNAYIAGILLHKLFGISFDYKKYCWAAVSMEYKFPSY
jgi:hypothetical protein